MKVLRPLAEQGKINPEASIRDSQSIIINAPIETVWNILADITNWPSWNPMLKVSEFDSLEAGKEFKWTMGGAGIASVIRKVQAPELLSWTGTALGIKAIHVWKLESTDHDQTIVTTEESLQGFFTLFFSHQKLHSTLLTWLEKLRATAEKA